MNIIVLVVPQKYPAAIVFIEKLIKNKKPSKTCKIFIKVFQLNSCLDSLNIGCLRILLPKLCQYYFISYARPLLKI